MVLLAVLAALELAPAPRAEVQRWSDLLQLGLATLACGLCVRAAARERTLGRGFWALIGLGILIWTAGQAVWTLESVALHPLVTFSLADLLFLACSTPFVIAALVRPDRPATSSAGLAFDASLLLVLLLYADTYFALGELVLGDPEQFQTWQTRLLGIRGTIVLLVFLWLVRGSRPPWRRLYDQLALALGLLYGAGAVVNVFLAAGRYHPGLMDVGWTLPWLWIALLATDWSPQSAPPSARDAAAVPEWRDTRRGTVLALLAVILVPALHFVSTSFGAPHPILQRLRGSITLAATVIVGGLFLLRQLHLLRRMEEAQREREASLRSSEERFLKAFRASPVAMSISTFAEGRILDANDRYALLTGYAREELLSRTVAELGLWVDAAEHETLLRSVGEKGSLRDAELRYRRKSGEIRAARTSYELIEVAGESCLLGLSEDVSDRRSLEAQLRQAQKMEAVGRLAGGIAHDFNNLLTAILGYTGLMIRRLPAPDPVRQHAEEIRKAGERAAELTRQLLAFSRKQVLLPQVLDLGLVVRETENMLRRLIGEDVELVTRVQSPLRAVRADAGQIEQVIVNLVVNARDAMPSGGRLTLDVRNVDLAEGFLREHPGAKEGPHVMLSVSDTGVGMSPEVQSHLFEPFFTTKEVGKGTGLGLATVYGIVKQSEGYIAARSELGRGSTFEVYLPRVEGAMAPARVERTAVPPRGTETVLVVEDEPAVRDLVREILAAAGYVVLEAASGAEALRRSRDHQGPIHLLMTDVVMPGMSGPELANQITSTRPGLRILFTSGYASDDLGPHGVLGPGRAFVQKPLTPDDLAERVREILDRSAT
ncbi:MAG TPA: ATP-binding protein [Vicinamibacteria bacterium]